MLTLISAGRSAALSLGILGLTSLLADGKDLGSLFRSGNYAEVIRLTELGNLSTAELRARAMALFKLQRLNEFIPLAQRLLNSSEDLEVRYAFAQANYSLKDYDKALPAFLITARANHQTVESRYYRGYIYWMQGEFRKAIPEFLAVAESIEHPLKAPGFYFLGESHMELIEDHPGSQKGRQELRRAQNHFQSALKFGLAPPLRAKAESRLKEIQRSLYPQKSPKKSALRTSLGTFHDNNLIAQSNSAIDKVANQGSFGQTISIMGRYTLEPTPPWEIIPTASGDYTRHLGTNSPLLRSYDNANLSAGLLQKFFLNNEQILSAEYRFSYGTRDHRFRHHLDYYSRSHSLDGTWGFKLLPIGITSLNAHCMLEENVNNLLNNANLGARLDQDLWATPTLQFFTSTSFDQNKARSRTFSNRKISLALTSTFYFGNGHSLSARTGYTRSDYHRIRPQQRTDHLKTLGLSGYWNTGWQGVFVTPEWNYSKNASPLRDTYRYEKIVTKLTVGMNL